MKKIKYLGLSVLVSGMLVACGGGDSKQSKEELDSKVKSELESKKSELEKDIKDAENTVKTDKKKVEEKLKDTKKDVISKIKLDKDFNCDGKILPITNSDKSFSNVGKFKMVVTDKKCPNTPSEACYMTINDNGVLKSFGKVKYDVDEDTCEKIEMNAEIKIVDKIFSKLENPIKQDENGKYIEEPELCAYTDTHEEINSIPEWVEKNALYSHIATSDIEIEKHFIIKDGDDLVRYGFDFEKDENHKHIDKAKCEQRDKELSKIYLKNEYLEEIDEDEITKIYRVE